MLGLELKASPLAVPCEVAVSRVLAVAAVEPVPVPFVPCPPVPASPCRSSSASPHRPPVRPFFPESCNDLGERFGGPRAVPVHCEDHDASALRTVHHGTRDPLCREPRVGSPEAISYWTADQPASAQASQPFIPLSPKRRPEIERLFAGEFFDDRLCVRVPASSRDALISSRAYGDAECVVRNLDCGWSERTRFPAVLLDPPAAHEHGWRDLLLQQDLDDLLVIPRPHGPWGRHRRSGRPCFVPRGPCSTITARRPGLHGR